MAMPNVLKLFATIAFSSSLPPTNQRRALTVFDPTRLFPIKYVCTCEVCSQFTMSAVFANIDAMLLWIQRRPAFSPDGEWCAEVVKNVIVRRRADFGSRA